MDLCVDKLNISDDIELDNSDDVVVVNMADQLDKKLNSKENQHQQSTAHLSHPKQGVTQQPQQGQSQHHMDVTTTMNMNNSLTQLQLQKQQILEQQELLRRRQMELEKQEELIRRKEFEEKEKYRALYFRQSEFDKLVRFFRAKL